MDVVVASGGFAATQERVLGRGSYDGSDSELKAAGRLFAGVLRRV
jgi:hypothetical protein